jgi:hypothetical protein
MRFATKYPRIQEQSLLLEQTLFSRLRTLLTLSLDLLPESQSFSFRPFRLSNPQLKVMVGGGVSLRQSIWVPKPSYPFFVSD